MGERKGGGNIVGGGGVGIEASDVCEKNKHATGAGPMSHGRSHLSSALESGHGNSVTKVPPTFVREMEYPVRDTSHPELTVPTNGEVDPDVLAADRATVSNNTEPAQAMLTAAVTVVPAAGAST